MNGSDPRRPLPASPARRGWCPGLTRMMPTGDGLLARIHPPLGILNVVQARTIAEGARRFGNGHIDLTARANLQVRGVREASAGPLARLLEAAGLGDVRDDGGPQRLTLTSPLAGRHPAEAIDVPALARAIEAAGRSIPGLPAKTLVAVEGRIGLAGPDADFCVAALAPDWVGIAVASEGGPLGLHACDAAEAPAALAGVLTAFARSGRRRARDLSADDRKNLADLCRTASAAPPPPSAGEGTPRSGGGEGSDASGYGAPHFRPSLTRGPPSPAEGEGRARPAIPPAGLGPLAPGLWVLSLDAPFGRCTTDALERVAEAADALGAGEIRLSSARGFVLLTRDRDRAAEALAWLADAYIVAPDDPRRGIAACTGAPACASGSTPTLADAARIAAALRHAVQKKTIHVSGCAKGCARPGPADLTLVARDGIYGAVVGGAPGDRPSLRLPIEAALERLGRAGTLGLAAAFAPDPAAGCGRECGPA